tara:strand:+ start:251 stop:451 length:201 start_codon:yes stop_codon:yes gene_type:complete
MVLMPRPRNAARRSLKVYTRDKDGVMKAIPGLTAFEVNNKIVKVYRLTPGFYEVNDPKGIQEIDFE